MYDVYAHAKSLETQDHLAFADAFERTYEEAIARLSDHDAYAVEEWLQASPQEARDDFQALLAQQRPMDTIDQADAVKLALGVSRVRSLSGVLAARGPARGQGRRPTLSSPMTRYSSRCRSGRASTSG